MGQTDEILIVKAKSTAEKEACFAIRVEVFVEEQKVPAEDEVDEYDKTALHFLAFSANKPVGTARVIFKNNGMTAKIGRVAVRKEARGKGIGAAIMIGIEADPDVQQASQFVLHAQTQAIPFYEKVGYKAYGEEFVEDDILHYAMSKDNRNEMPMVNASLSKAAL